MRNEVVGTNGYEFKALLYAERFGIIEYKVERNKMIYFEVFSKDTVYKAIVDLDKLMEEKRIKQ